MKRTVFTVSVLLWAGLCHAQLRQSCDHYQEQIDNGEATPQLFFEAAACKGTNGAMDEALDWLEQAAANGFDDQDLLANASAFDSVRTDQRYLDAAEQIKRTALRRKGEQHAELYQLYRDTLDAADPAAAAHARLARVRTLAEEGAPVHARDFFHAAAVGRYADDAADLARAKAWADKAYALDPNLEGAAALVCTLEDAVLHAAGKPQVWGTHWQQQDGKWTLDPFDRTAKSEEDRTRMGMPNLEDLAREAARRNGVTDKTDYH